MKRLILVRALASSAVVIVVLGALDSLLGKEEDKGKRAEVKPGAAAFSSPGEAWNKFLDRRSSAATSNAVAEYLVQIVNDKDVPLGISHPACNYLLHVYNQTGAYEKVIQLGTRLLETDKDPGFVMDVISSLYLAYQSLNDWPSARKVLDAYLVKNRELLTPAPVAQITMILATIYRDAMNRSEDAVALLEREAKLMPSNAAPHQALLLSAAADIYASKLKAPAKAEETYQKILGMKDNLSPATVANMNLGLAQLYRDMGRKDDALKLVMGVMKGSTSYPSAQTVEILITLDAPDTQLDEACWLQRGAIVESIRWGGDGGAYQQDLVRLLMKRGKFEEALQEARVYYYTCPETSLLPAVNLVALAFKALDGNLSRANRYLRYMKSGPAGADGKHGTEDDLTDVLKEVPAINLERRTAIYRDALNKFSSDWVGYRRQGLIHLYLEDPQAAVMAFKKSFERCPVTDAEIQSAADALTGLIVRSTRESGPAQTLVDYLMFGSAGKDGKEGTTDDLKDPTAGIIEKIRWAATKRGALANQDSP